MTPDVKYLGGTLDSELNFNKDISMKIRKAMSNFHMHKGNKEIPYQISINNTSTIPMHIAP